MRLACKQPWTLWFTFYGVRPEIVVKFSHTVHIKILTFFVVFGKTKGQIVFYLGSKDSKSHNLYEAILLQLLQTTDFFETYKIVA